MNYKQTTIGVVALLVLWQLVSLLGIFNPIYFASPYEVFVEGVKMFKGEGIYLDIWDTLRRVLISGLISAVIAIPVGLVLGYFTNAYKYLGGIIDFLRSIPPIILYPLLLITVGTGDESRIGVAVFGAIVVLIMIISKGLFQQSNLRQDYFLAMGASRWQVLKNVIWYEGLPHVMTGMRTAVSLIIIIVIVTEMLVGSQYGLGVRVQNVQITSNIPDLFVTIIVIGLMGVILNQFLIFLDKKLVFWKNN